MINRLEPTLPVTEMRTFGIRVPQSAQRPATCAEVDCPHWRNGWRTVVPSDSPEAAYIKTASGRRYVEEDAGPGLAAFTFEAGQQCFASAHHRVLATDPVFGSRAGDWRGNPGGVTRRYRTAEDWRDDLGETLENVKARIERG